MEQAALRELLKRCTVRLLVRGQSQGTGFFVALGTILTCAHVIQEAYGSDGLVEVYAWDNQLIERVSVDKGKYFLEALPVKDAILDPKRVNLYPDLALLQVTQKEHPCVYIDQRIDAHAALFSYGYPEGYLSGDGVEFTYEDRSWIDSTRYLLKFREGQAQTGLSGGPLLNMDTGGVCGIVQKTRTADMGGRAIPISKALDVFPELQILQKQFHQHDTQWTESLTPQQKTLLGLSPSKPIESSLRPIEVFYSYADTKRDAAMLEELLKQLTLLRRRGIISNWYSGNVALGEIPTEETLRHLDTAKIILLLVSPDYVASDDLADVHVKRAMERHNAKDPIQKAVVIPILLRHTDNWREEPFGGLQVLPRNQKPISQWSDSDEAFAEVAREIRGVVTKLQAQQF